MGVECYYRMTILFTRGRIGCRFVFCFRQYYLERSMSLSLICEEVKGILSLVMRWNFHYLCWKLQGESGAGLVYCWLLVGCFVRSLRRCWLGRQRLLEMNWQVVSIWMHCCLVSGFRLWCLISCQKVLVMNWQVVSVWLPSCWNVERCSALHVL